MDGVGVEVVGGAARPFRGFGNVKYCGVPIGAPPFLVSIDTEFPARFLARPARINDSLERAKFCRHLIRSLVPSPLQ